MLGEGQTLDDVVTFYTKKYYVSREFMGMKRLKIKNPIECRLEFHLHVNKCVLTKETLNATNAAILFIDVCKEWELNKILIGEHLQALKIEDLK